MIDPMSFIIGEVFGFALSAAATFAYYKWVRK